MCSKYYLRSVLHFELDFIQFMAILKIETILFDMMNTALYVREPRFIMLTIGEKH